jgi:hypothetical protein
MGIVEGLRKAEPGQRKRIVIRMGAVSAFLFLYVLLFASRGNRQLLAFVSLFPLFIGFAQRHPWGRVPAGMGPPSSFRRDLGVALLSGSVTVLALVVKALWRA